MVITQTDYVRYQDKRSMVWNRLKNESATSTVLYIGYSGRDPNWQMIIEEMSREFLPSEPPTAYRIDPFADELDIELHKKVRNLVKPSFVLIQPEDGPLIISFTTMIHRTLLQRGDKVTFELSFSAKGPLAENLMLP